MAIADPDFPCSLVIDLPMPSHRLAAFALKALQVDAELSPLVRRSFTLAAPGAAAPPLPQSQPAAAAAPTGSTNGGGGGSSAAAAVEGEEEDEEEKTVFRTEYKAATNRMLRVAVNGFMESLGVVLGVMAELDVDVLESQKGVQ